VDTWPSTQGTRNGVTNFVGSITSSPDGHYVYVANRGLDTVTVFTTDPARAGPIAEFGSGGVWPSHLLTHGSWLFVANRDSHDVTRFEVDARTGLLESPTTVVRTEHPGCLLLWSRPCP
jgi:6-phosphogluconolactonase